MKNKTNNVLFVSIVRRGNKLCACAAIGLMLVGCTAGNMPEKVVDIPVLTATAAMKTPVFVKTPDQTPTASPTPEIATPLPTSSPDEVKKSYPTDDDAFYYQDLDEALKKRITGMSFPSNDEDRRISYDDLRYVGIKYYDFEGNEHKGELIVNRKLAKEVTEIFYDLYQNEYPLASVRLVDDYGEPGDDNLSMAANNSSAFNYRRVTGSKKLSRHSYGAAVDINPLYNPYIEGDRVAPPEGEAYVDRTADFPGKIDHDDLCYQLFKQHGWSWGGDWSGDKDYQHFSKDIGDY